LAFVGREQFEHTAAALALRHDVKHSGEHPGEVRAGSVNEAADWHRGATDDTSRPKRLSLWRVRDAYLILWHDLLTKRNVWPAVWMRSKGKLPEQSVYTTVRDAVAVLFQRNHATWSQLGESLRGIPLTCHLLAKCVGFQFITVRVVSDLVISILHFGRLGGFQMNR
jgi:hypothetical protein